MAQDRIVGDDLLAIAHTFDTKITHRTLEFWRSEGLLPRPMRSGQAGKRPMWTYPVQASQQLRRLLQLRKTISNLDALRVALWCESYDIDITRVRASMTAYLQGLRSTLDRELKKRLPAEASGDDDLSAIEDLAFTLAKKRGKGRIRSSRQSLHDRTQAIALLLSLSLNNDVAVSFEAYTPALERMTGLDHGRRSIGGNPGWLNAPYEQVNESIKTFGNLRHLVSVLESSPDDELEMARNLCTTLLDGLLTATKITDAYHGKANALGFGGIRASEGNPEILALLIPLLLSLLQSPQQRNNIESLTKFLEETVLPVGKQMKELAMLTAEERSHHLKDLPNRPWRDRLIIQQALYEFLDKS
jgi:DNA-binding transcriptional MerR regulator